MSAEHKDHRVTDGIANLLLDTDLPAAVSIIDGAFCVMSVVSGAIFAYRADVGNAPRIELTRACVWIETEFTDEWINVFTIETINGCGPKPQVTLDPIEAGRKLLELEAELETTSTLKRERLLAKRKVQVPIGVGSGSISMPLLKPRCPRTVLPWRG